MKEIFFKKNGHEITGMLSLQGGEYKWQGKLRSLIQGRPEKNVKNISYWLHLFLIYPVCM